MEDLNELLAMAVSLMKQGCWREVLEVSDRAVRLDTNSAFAHLWRGWALFQLADFNGALEAFERTVELDPGDPAPRNGRANALSELGRFEEALEDYNKAIELAPGDPAFRNGRGNALYGLRRFDEALEAYNKAIELHPGGPIPYYGRGNAIFSLLRFEEALEDYNKAIELASESPKYRYGRGRALRQLGQYEEALEAFDKAIELDPEYPAFRNGRGDALSDLSQYEEALGAFDKAIELDPEYPDPRNGRGNALYGLGRFDEALEAYNKAIEFDRGDLVLRNGRGNALFQLGRFEEALKDYNKAIELDPGDTAPRNGRGNALLRLGQYEEALEAFDKAIELDPEDPNPHNGRGHALIRLLRFEEALPAFDKAIELDPENPKSRYGRGNALLQLGRFEEALPAFDKAIELDLTAYAPWIGKAQTLVQPGIGTGAETAQQCLNRGLFLFDKKRDFLLDTVRVSLGLLSAYLDAPLLLWKLAPLSPGALMASEAAAGTSDILRRAQVPAAVIAWLDEQQGTLDVADRLLLKARTLIVFGDAPQALRTLETLDELGPNCLAGQLYYLWAMMACLEPQTEIDGQLDWVRGLVQTTLNNPAASAEECYYAGHLALMLEDDDSTWTAFSRAHNHHAPALFMAWLTANRLEKADEARDLRAAIIQREVERSCADQPGFLIPFDLPPFDPADPESLAMFEHVLQQFEIEEALHELLSIEDEATDAIYKETARRMRGTIRNEAPEERLPSSHHMNIVEEWERSVHAWELQHEYVLKMRRQRRARTERWIESRRAEHRAAFERLDRDADLSGDELERAVAERVFDGVELSPAQVTGVIEVLHAEHRVAAGQALSLMLYATFRGSFDRGEFNKRLMVRGAAHCLDVVLAVSIMALDGRWFIALLSGGAMGVSISEKIAEEIENWLIQRRRKGVNSFPEYTRFQTELLDRLSESRDLWKMLRKLGADN